MFIKNVSNNVIFLSISSPINRCQSFQIKICGLFGIKDIKEQNFTYKDDQNTDSESNYVNSINDIRIIQGLMLIFDLKYDSKFNYKNIINKDYKGESFVEITLHQKEADKFSHYDWVRYS